MDQIQEIKTRLNIEDVIGSYVQLKKAGRNLKGHCPFHNEKTPSFIVSPEKQIAHCFGCHWGGDVIKFVQDYEKVEFIEALESLANRAGVKLEKRGRSAENKSEKKMLKNLHRDAAEFFQKKLKTNKEAMKYLKDRGMTDKTIEAFQIGWAPDNYHQAHKYLEKEGYSKKDIVLAGIGSKKQMASEEIFDRFRGRIIFPIWDNLDAIIAFGGRTLKNKKDMAKYLNSPDTPIYNKGHVIYGFNFAKKEIRSTEKAVVVEGYFDVITAYQAGFKNVVASSGTALTENQLKLLKRHAKEIIFSFDADEAGQEAALRSIELAQKMDCNIKILTVPEGKDPDDCIKKDPKLWEKAVENSVPYMDFVFEKACKNNSSETAEGKKKISDIILKSISRIQNAVEQEHHLQKLGNLISTSVRSLLQELKKLKKSSRPAPSAPEPQSQASHDSHSSRAQTLTLSLILSDLSLLKTHKDKISKKFFEDEEKKELYKTLLDHYNPLDSDIELEEYFKGEKRDKIKILSLIGQEYYKSLSEKERQQELDFLIKKINKSHQKSRIQELKQELRKNTKNKKALEELNSLLKN